jgi:hypothetical protein
MAARVQYNLTLNLLTTTIVAPPSNASKWQMGFNSAFKGLICFTINCFFYIFYILLTMYHVMILGK